jgi:DNA-binding NarL/FixJ family response regulator
MYSYVLLIVEDDPLCARTLSRLCRQSLGVTVICVAVGDADEAAALGVEYLQTHRPDVVVVDGLDGLFEAVVGAAKELQIPAIVYTGAAEKYQGRGVPVYAKPDHAALLGKIRNILETTETLS